MLETKFKRIIIFGDSCGVALLVKYIPRELIKCIIAASIRPQYLDDLYRLADSLKVSFLIQPKFRRKEFQKFVKEFALFSPDLILSNSYSMIIRGDILKLVNYNAINIHGSLLPRNRGCNPIQWAIINGEKETGVTIHYLDNNVDSGDIIAQKKIDIEFEDTWVKVRAKFILAMEELIKENIPNVLAGINTRTRQDDSRATFNPRLNPEFPKIDFKTMDDTKIYNLIRAQVKPLKGAYLCYQGQRIYLDEFIEYHRIKELRARYGG